MSDGHKEEVLIQCLLASVFSLYLPMCWQGVGEEGAGVWGVQGCGGAGVCVGRLGEGVGGKTHKSSPLLGIHHLV